MRAPRPLAARAAPSPSSGAGGRARPPSLGSLIGPFMTRGGGGSLFQTWQKQLKKNRPRHCRKRTFQGFGADSSPQTNQPTPNRYPVKATVMPAPGRVRINFANFCQFKFGKLLVTKNADFQTDVLLKGGQNQKTIADF